jgi:N-acetylglucosaminyldiphosphoundecaprenol N-acetyl-beta-D-mannosaminyltransferase
VMGTRIDATTYDEATSRVVNWAKEGGSHYVCCANLHMLLESYQDRNFRQIVNGASLVTPDGMPLVWILKGRGFRAQKRVYGPTLMLKICGAAARTGLPIGLHGGHPEALRVLVERLHARFHGLVIAHCESPPFRSLREQEIESECTRILRSGARVVFVGLGCPTQERWMAERRSRLPLVTIGVGAAFDFHAGIKPQAPRWMQSSGLEWLFRAASEPNRLGPRYLRQLGFLPTLIRREVADLLSSQAGDHGDRRPVR